MRIWLSKKNVITTLKSYPTKETKGWISLRNNKKTLLPGQYSALNSAEKSFQFHEYPITF